MRKVILSCVFFISIMALVACNNEKADEEILASTKNGNVTKEDLYNEMKNSIGAEAFENLVLKIVIEEEFKLTDEEIQKEIDMQKDFYGERFEQYLQQNNYTEEFFEKQVEFSLLQKKLIQSLEDVTEEEIENEYELMKREIHARHILVEDLKTAENLIKQLKDGADFATVAKENTIEPIGQRTGGELGWFAPGKMVQEFDDVAFTLEINEISEPVRTSFGYHIIQVLDEREKELDKSLEELTPKIEDRLYEKRFNQKITELFKKANVEVKDDSLKHGLNMFLLSDEDE